MSFDIFFPYDLIQVLMNFYCLFLRKMIYYLFQKPNLFDLSIWSYFFYFLACLSDLLFNSCRSYKHSAKDSKPDTWPAFVNLSAILTEEIISSGICARKGCNSCLFLTYLADLIIKFPRILYPCFCSHKISEERNLMGTQNP